MASSNLPPVWRFDFGDYSSLGPVFQKFLANLNLFTLAVYNLLNGGIGFTNLQRAIYSTTVLAGTTTPLVFVNPLTVAPSGIAVVKVLLSGKTNTALTSAVSAANWYYDGKSVNILNITGLTSGSTYEISLEVM
jgi:hypothetical protein